MKTAAPISPDDAFTPVRGVRLYETIIEQIATLVQNGQLTNGDRFPTERALQEKWRVSRPVLREAFRALEMQGIVESRPGGGRYLRAERIPHPAEFRVLRLTDSRETLLHVWQAREAVEVIASASVRAGSLMRLILPGGVWFCHSEHRLRSLASLGMTY